MIHTRDNVVWLNRKYPNYSEDDDRYHVRQTSNVLEGSNVVLAPEILLSRSFAVSDRVKYPCFILHRLNET